MEIETEVRKIHCRIDILCGQVDEIQAVQARHEDMLTKLAEAPEFDDYKPDQYDAALEAAEAAANDARIAKVSALLAAWRSRYR